MPLFLHLSFSCNVDDDSKKLASMGSNDDVSHERHNDMEDAGGEGTKSDAASALCREDEGSWMNVMFRGTPIFNISRVSIMNVKRMPRVVYDAVVRAWRRCASAVDGRSLIHSFKAGLALGLVSCGVLLQQVYDRLGKNVLWAVLTVVVVFECTVGITPFTLFSV